MNEIEALFRAHAGPEAFARGYVDYLTKILNALDMQSVAGFIQVLIEARERGARIFFLGNGGSASTGSHFANDLAIGSRSRRKPLRAISLSDNVSVLTALANDYGYAEVFVRQLEVQMQPGDVVVAISASGNSPNVVNALQYANEHGAVTIGLTGFDGGHVSALARIVIHVATNPGEYGPVEDVHLVLDHLITAFLMHHCATEQGGSD